MRSHLRERMHQISSGTSKKRIDGHKEQTPFGKHLRHKCPMCLRGMPTRDQNKKSNYHATTNLLQNKSQKEETRTLTTRNSPQQRRYRIKGLRRPKLQCQLAVSVFTWRRRWRTAAPNATCLFCTTGHPETIKQINWKCPA